MAAQFRPAQIGLAETLVRLEEDDGAVAVLRGPHGPRHEPSPLAAKGFFDLEQVWVCGNHSGRVLLAHPGGAPVAEAVPPRNDRERQNWLREFDRPSPWFPFPDRDDAD